MNHSRCLSQVNDSLTVFVEFVKSVKVNRQFSIFSYDFMDIH